MRKYAVLLLVALTFGSCHQFEDGPDFSFRTKTTRISREWVLQDVLRNELDTVTSEYHFGISFDGDENFVLRDTSYASGSAVETVTSGVWQFNDDDLLILLFTDGNGINSSRVWRILRLSTEEFWAIEQVNNDYYEYHLVERP
ncbi:MAG: hypothetical protein SFW35_10655 [Chitinophagales bacterium]|nr:hypothetical protein [Chitinophagales bacterium]